MWKIICLFVILALTIQTGDASRDTNNKPYRVVCYLGSWANYRYGEGKFLIEHIDPFICTHVVYGFAKLGPDNRIAAYDPYLDLKENWGLGAFQRFNGLKKQNPHLTTILAIGGWNEGSVKYSNMAANPASRKTFVDSVVEFLTKYDFDGLDMDWEYPAMRGGKPEDKENFIHLLRDLKEGFEPHGFILTAAVSAGKHTIDPAYDIPQMSKYLDFINLMAYDFHGSWENFAGHNAPLYPREEESEDQKVLNVDFAVNYWLDKGCPKNKLVLGMALYGRSFTLKDANNNGLDAPVTGKGMAGPITREGGMLGYNEICKFVGKENWKVEWVESIKSPYAYKDRQWVGYDDQKSIKIKVDYLKEKGLGGGMVWSIETDDFRGLCHGHKYPLLTIIQTELNGPITRPEVIPDEDTTTVRGKVTFQPTEPPKPFVSTTGTGLELKCDKQGFHRYPGDCSKFYECIPSGSSFKVITYDCPPGTAFDIKISGCNHPSSVEGCFKTRNWEKLIKNLSVFITILSIRLNCQHSKMRKAIYFLSLLAMVVVNEAASRDRNNKPYRVVCYLGSWANYRHGEGKFVIEDINPFICTHLVYGFAKLELDNKIVEYDPYLDLKENWGLGAYQRFNDLKKKNPNLTTLLAIGGWNEGSIKYSKMTSSHKTRKIFVDSCLRFLTKYNFDGLDLDWEYPAMRGGKPEDRTNFIYLIQELKKAFEPHGFLLTAAVSAGKPTIDVAYNIPQMSKYLDFINLMAYDFNGAWNSFTGHNSPLYAREEEPESQKIFNVDFAVNYWLNNGCPKHKLVLGMPLYGRSFTLKDANKHGLGAYATGPGTAGPVTGEGGMLGYNEICKFITQENWKTEWDDSIKSPYAHKDRQWVGYDDQKSIKIKVDYLKRHGLSGGMVWSIDTDDFGGLCHGHKFPLLSIIKNELNGPDTDPTVFPDNFKTTNYGKPDQVHTTNPPKPIYTTKIPEVVIECESVGYFRYPGDCSKFYQCYKLGNNFEVAIYNCPPNTVFDTKETACNYPEFVEGC
ncbi:probable chitinase 10 [Centruroides sculpturatus]|uniref:probable chitinase 10 n=1 Tax=Centruroides sculpturatus TaxID=218467 RepID=UPI000C6D4550|nr:probable chitinase 10 [Centruroides sculpturatus]